MSDPTPLDDLIDLRDELLELHQESPEMDTTWEWFKVTGAAVEELMSAEALNPLKDAVEELLYSLDADDDMRILLGSLGKFVQAFTEVVEEYDLSTELDTAKILELVEKKKLEEE